MTLPHNLFVYRPALPPPPPPAVVARPPSPEVPAEPFQDLSPSPAAHPEPQTQHEDPVVEEEPLQSNAGWEEPTTVQAPIWDEPAQSAPVVETPSPSAVPPAPVPPPAELPISPPEPAVAKPTRLSRAGYRGPQGQAVVMPPSSTQIANVGMQFGSLSLGGDEMYVCVRFHLRSF